VKQKAVGLLKTKQTTSCT